MPATNLTSVLPAVTGRVLSLFSERNRWRVRPMLTECEPWVVTGSTLGGVAAAALGSGITGALDRIGIVTGDFLLTGRSAARTPIRRPRPRRKRGPAPASR
jgi:hypothetical protein